MASLGPDEVMRAMARLEMLSQALLDACDACRGNGAEYLEMLELIGGLHPMFVEENGWDEDRPLPGVVVAEDMFVALRVTEPGSPPIEYDLRHMALPASDRGRAKANVRALSDALVQALDSGTQRRGEVEHLIELVDLIDWNQRPLPEVDLIDGRFTMLRIHDPTINRGGVRAFSLHHLELSGLPVWELRMRSVSSIMLGD